MLIELPVEPFADNLRRLRQKRRLSQKALARQAGMHVYILHAIEHESIYPVFSPEMLRALSKALDIPTDDLINGTHSI